MFAQDVSATFMSVDGETEGRETSSLLRAHFCQPWGNHPGVWGTGSVDRQTAAVRWVLRPSLLLLSIHEQTHIWGPGRLQLVCELRRPWVKLLPCVGLRSQREQVQPTPLADQAVPTRTFFLATGPPRSP